MALSKLKKKIEDATSAVSNVLSQVNDALASKKSSSSSTTTSTPKTATPIPAKTSMPKTSTPKTAAPQTNTSLYQSEVQRYNTWAADQKKQQAQGYNFKSSKDVTKVGNGVTDYLNSGKYTRDNHDSYRAQLNDGLNYINGQMENYHANSKAYKALKKYRDYYTGALSDLDRTGVYFDAKDYVEDTNWHDEAYRNQYNETMKSNIDRLYSEMESITDKKSAEYKRLSTYYNWYVNDLYAAVNRRDQVDSNFKTADDYVAYTDSFDYSKTLDLKNKISGAQAEIAKLTGVDPNAPKAIEDNAANRGNTLLHGLTNMGEGVIRGATSNQFGKTALIASQLITQGPAAAIAMSDEINRIQGTQSAAAAIEGDTPEAKQARARVKELEKQVQEWQGLLDARQKYQTETVAYNNPFDVDVDYGAKIQELEDLKSKADNVNDAEKIQTQIDYFTNCAEQQALIKTDVDALQQEIDDLKTTINDNAKNGRGDENPYLYAQLEEKQDYVASARRTQDSFRQTNTYKTQTRTPRADEYELWQDGQSILKKNNPLALPNSGKNLRVNLNGESRTLGQYFSQGMIDANSDILTDEERATVYRLIGQAQKTGSEEDAKTLLDYCDYLDDRAAVQKALTRAEKIEGFSPTGRWLANQGTSIERGLFNVFGAEAYGSALADHWAKKLGMEKTGWLEDSAKNWSRTFDYMDTTQQAAMQSLGAHDPAALQNFLGTGESLSQFVGEGLETTANMVPGIVLGNAVGAAGGSEELAKVLSTSLLGAGAANSSYRQAKQQGYSEGQALLYGGVMGATEMASEYWVESVAGRVGISEGELMKYTENISNAHLKFAAQLGARVSGELLEEYAQNKVEYLVNDLILNQYDKFSVFNSDDWHTVLATAFSTAMLEVAGGGVAHSTYHADKTGKAFTTGETKNGLVSRREADFNKAVANAGKVLSTDANAKNALIYLCSELDADSATDNNVKNAIEEAKALADRIESGKSKASDSNLGRLIQLYVQANGGDSNIASVKLLAGATAYEEQQSRKAANTAAQENLNAVKEANPDAQVLDTVQSELRTYDGTLTLKQTQTAADLINQAASGEQLTDAQINQIASNTRVGQVVRTWLANHGANINATITGEAAKTALNEYLDNVRNIKANQRELGKAAVILSAEQAANKTAVSEATASNKVQVQERATPEAKEKLFTAQTEAAEAGKALSELEGKNSVEIALEATMTDEQKLERQIKQTNEKRNQLNEELIKLQNKKGILSAGDQTRANDLREEMVETMQEQAKLMDQYNALKTKGKTERSEAAQAQKAAFDEMTGVAKPAESGIIEASNAKENTDGRTTEGTTPVGSEPDVGRGQAVSDGSGRVDNELTDQRAESGAGEREAVRRTDGTGDQGSRRRVRTRALGRTVRQGLKAGVAEALGITEKTDTREITDTRGSAVLSDFNRVAKGLGFKPHILVNRFNINDPEQLNTLKNAKANGAFIKGDGSLFVLAKNNVEQFGKHEVAHGALDSAYGNESYAESKKLLSQALKELGVTEEQYRQVLSLYKKRAGELYAKNKKVSADTEAVRASLREDIFNDMLTGDKKLLSMLPDGARQKALDVFRASQTVERAIENSNSRLSAEDVYAWLGAENREADFDFDFADDEAREAEKLQKAKERRAQKKAAEKAAKQQQAEAANADEPFVYGANGETLTREQYIEKHKDFKDPGAVFDRIIEKTRAAEAEPVVEETPAPVVEEAPAPAVEEAVEPNYDDFTETDKEWMRRFDAVDDLLENLQRSKDLQSFAEQLEPMYDKLNEEDTPLNERARIYAQLNDLVEAAKKQADARGVQRLEVWQKNNGKLFDIANDALFSTAEDDEYYDAEYQAALINDELELYGSALAPVLASFGYDTSDIAPEFDWAYANSLGRDELQDYVESYLTSDAQAKREALHAFDTEEARDELLDLSIDAMQNTVFGFDGLTASPEFAQRLADLQIDNDAYALQYAFDEDFDYGVVLTRNIAEQAQSQDDLQSIAVLLDYLTPNASSVVESAIEDEIAKVKTRLEIQDQTDKARFYTLSEFRDVFDAGRNELGEDIGELGDKVFETARRLGLKMFSIPYEGVRNMDAASLADLISVDQKRFNNRRSWTPKQKATLVLHELIHSCTSYAFNAYENGTLTDEGMRSAVETLNGIYDELTQDDSLYTTKKGERTAKYYGLTNAKEMTAELANPEWRKVLKKKNVFTRIVDAVKNFFGIGNTAEDTATNALNYLLDNLDQDLYDNYVKVTREKGLGTEYGSYTHPVTGEQVYAKGTPMSMDLERMQEAYRKFTGDENAVFSTADEVVNPSNRENTAEIDHETPTTPEAFQPNTYPEGSFESQLLSLLQDNEFDLDAVNNALNELYTTRMGELARQNGTQEPNVIPSKFTANMKPGEDQVLSDQLAELVKRFGAMEPGFKSARDVIMPKKQSEGRFVRRFEQSAANAEGTPDYMVPYIDKAVITDLGASYVRQHNADAEAKARMMIGDNYEKANQMWDGIASASHIPTSSDIALGELLFMQAAQEGQVNRAMKILADVAAMGTAAGQTVQAMSMIKKLTPAGQLYYLQQAVNRLNKQNEKLIISGKTQALKINDEMADRVFNAQSKEELDAAIEDIKNDLASQLPVTVKDKWDAWRYLSMLGNPRTHIRNIFGNAVFMPARLVKDVIASGLETAFIRDQNKRTKNLGQALASSAGTAANLFTGRVSAGKQADSGSAYTEFANSDFDVMRSVVAQSGKYNAIDDLRDRRQVLRPKALEKVSRLNTDALEGEDAIFLKRAYVSAMSQFLAARNADVSKLMDNSVESNRLLNEARQHATLEAQKATYRDFSAAAAALNKMKKIPGIGTLVEGVLPFTKTPINILKRGVEYSPAGLVKALTADMVRVKQGKITAAQAIDNIAAGMSGTMIMALGVLLAHMGVATGKDDDDDKQAEFDALQGQQKYALKIGDGSYTIDWMAPVSLPFFVGVEMYNAFANDAKIDMTPTNLYQSMMSVAEPILSLSMLDGLANVLSADDYVQGDAAKVATTVTTAAGSYVGQGIPTILGQLGRTIDGSRHATYIDKSSKVPADIQYFWQSSVQSKIPGYLSQKMDYVDEWGRKDEGINSVVLRAIQNFASPGYYRELVTTATDDELQRLADATGDTSVLPTKAQKYFSVQGERKNLTADEYEAIQIDRGQTAYHLLTTLINDSRYKGLSDAEKAKVVSYYYKYANATSQYHIDNNYDLHGQGVWIEEAEKMDNPYERIWEQAFSAVEKNRKK